MYLSFVAQMRVSNSTSFFSAKNGNSRDQNKIKLKTFDDNL